MAKAKTRSGPVTGRRVQHSRPAPRQRVRLGWLISAAVVVVAAVAAFLIAKNQAAGPSAAVAPPASGLPDTPDYHSLLVSTTDPQRVVLGTHAGLYQSADGGRTWAEAGLVGMDAMNLVRTADSTVWTAGHDVLARSADGGRTWKSARPEGLPSLDVHGFARDPSDPERLYAAVAGQGLYGSKDGGRSFRLVSDEVGGSVFGLAVTPTGRILAGDGQQGLLKSDDRGRTWSVVERMTVFGLAVNPADPDVVIAAGQGAAFSGILVSRDGGDTWSQALSIKEGAGPAAWAPSDPKVGYVVGFDRNLYRTQDDGTSWQPVA